LSRPVRRRSTLARLIALVAAAAVPAIAGDAQHGAVVVMQEGCLECHTVQGSGAGHEPAGVPGARDLADKLMPTYTPSALASALWNHTPAMWRSMAERSVAQPAAKEADWDDLFTWIYALQFSEQPGEVARGKAAFESNGCASCHSGEIVRQWSPFDDPVVLVYRLWTHSSAMRPQMVNRRTPWPIMTGRDFMDITAYIQTTQRQLVASHFALPDPSTGRLTFVQKCGVCHTGPMALENRVSNQTWIDLGAAMWNHSPLMQAAAQPLPAVNLAEMRSILSYVWETQYQGPRGNRALGERVFEKAGCISCHRSPGTGAPMRPGARNSYAPWSMVALGWGPARTMHQQMIANGTPWPTLSPADMNDLTAYLNSLPKQQTPRPRIECKP